MNSKNVKIDFTKEPYVIRDIGKLLDYSWDYDTSNDKVTSLFRKVCEIPLSISVYSDSEGEYFAACNHFEDVVDYDTYNKKKGRLYYNGQFVLCNLISSQKEDWCMGIPFHINNVKLLTDKAYWIEEKTTTFNTDKNESTIIGGLNYPYNYPYNYSPRHNVDYIENEHTRECDFNMTIYGPCTNPSVQIGDDTYALEDVVLYEGEYLVIVTIDMVGRLDKKDRIIEKHCNDGRIENLFNNRVFSHDIFKSIPPGKNVIVRSSLYGLDITLYYERSCPRWISL